MRIFIHDYAGHPFQIQLSRELASRGHDVLHAYCGSFQSPRGAMTRRPGDPVGFTPRALDLGAPVPKNGYWRRFRMEAKYGSLLVDACREFGPDVVMSANTPSIPQRRLVRFCRTSGVRHVFWVQDIYGVAAYNLLKRRMPILGHAVGRYFMGLDRTSARLSDALVVITEDFRKVFENWGVESARIHVIQNWSVLEELPQRPRDNEWSREHGLADGPRLLYTGTLAMKHNPALLLELAQLLDERGAGQLIVVSEGAGVEWLRAEANAQRVHCLRTFGFQPFERMADCLASADLLLVILEPEAGTFSVPSKVLSYMCAGRALLGAMPRQNLAARLIVEQGAGIVVEPTDPAGFRAAAVALLAAPQELAAHGLAARLYAEQNFDIQRITDRFEQVLAA